MTIEDEVERESEERDTRRRQPSEAMQKLTDLRAATIAALHKLVVDTESFGPTARAPILKEVAIGFAVIDDAMSKRTCRNIKAAYRQRDR